MRVRRGQAGFTLVELAVVLLVVTLLLGSILVPLATQVEQRKVAQAQALLEDTREAIIGYAMMKGRLPRPAASATDGQEPLDTCAVLAVSDPTKDAVAHCTGFVPWATLGVPRLDPWGKQLRYSVSPNFADGAFTFSTPTTNHKRVCPSATSCTLPVVTDVPAVIVSQGAQNWGFRDDGGEFADGSATNADEDANDSKFKCTVAANCNDFVSRTPSTNASAAGGEFDDLVTWISSPLLFNRMVSAGRLP
jgi:prepilin-type N-terminal cleavage/methylation domain-containing protein